MKDVNCFPKRRDTQLGVRRNCKMCLKKHIENNREKNQNRREKNALDPNYKILCILTRRTNNAFNLQNIKKNNKTFDLLGCSKSFFKDWIIFQ